jgi:Cytochrome oxidase complex assembly protein 1
MAISTIALLLLVVAGAWILSFERQARAPVALAARIAQSSARVRQLLGEPMRVSRIAKGSIISHSGEGNADLTVQIRGPLGRGKLDEWAQEENGKWHICGLQFEPSDSSASVTIIEESLTHCEPE